MNWQRLLRGKIKINDCLARHTTLKIGGPAQFFIEPKDLSDLQYLINLTHKRKMPLRVIGAGSNILVDDRGIKGAVIKLNSPYFKKLSVNQMGISAGAGLRLGRLVRYAQEKGLSGFELLAGIPGTLGGALVMNAGNIGDRTQDVTVMDTQARVKILTRKDIRFGYRKSNLIYYIILSANFKLIKRDKKTIKKSIDEYINYRKETQDLAWPSAGCFFKNPDSRSAAYFIERCGLKGVCFGDAAVSIKHANYIINKGKASFDDTLKLMMYIIKCVKKRYNLDLEPEIKIWKRV